MGLALDGIIAGQRLPERVKRVAAGNPVDQAAGGWDLAPALANRFVHLNWPAPSVSAWTDWLSGQSSAATGIHLDLDAWEHQWPQARALGAAFIRSHPSCLHEDVAKVLGRQPPAYATPRSWEAALRLLASCRAMGCMDIYPSLAQGCLGPAVALEGADGKGGAWLVWLKDNDLPDPEDLLKDPGKFSHDPRRPDRSYATLLAVAEAGLAHTNGKKLSPQARGERWNAAWEVLARGLFDLKLGKDVVLLPGRLLASPERRVKCPSGPAARKVCGILTDFVDLFDMPTSK